MRGQWTSYDNFNLIELIDEVKTRIKEPFRIDDTIHGALIVRKDYYGLCKELRDFLERDDDREIIEMIEERDKNDDGTRYTSEDVIRMRRVGVLTYSPLTKDKKKILEELMGSTSSKQIDFNKVRDEWRDRNEN